MELLRRGRQIGQAVKNVQRLRQIAAVFARHGFADVIHRMTLGRYVPTRLRPAEASADIAVQERLRHAFEELGPTFVKLGQVLSTRPDLMPQPFIDEFTKLQDDVQPLPWEVVEATIQAELGKRIQEAYAEFSHVPLAAASIGQVHAARLHSGQQVVVKVQRPEIKKLIDSDVSILAFIARAMEKYIPETRLLSPTIFVDEFFKALSFELDFLVEANNMQKIADNMSSIPEVVVPKVFKHLSTSRILTLERLDGIRVNDIKALDAAGIDRKHVVKVGARAFFKSVMIDGIFHGDLHGGNLFVLPGDRLGIIDFGIVGRLSQRSRDQLAAMVMALLSEDYETLCYQYAELGASGPSIDFEGFQREVRNTLSPYMGLSITDMNAGRILIEATKIATKYQIKVPGDWMIVFKAILTIEGMGRSLDPEFDLMSAGQDLVKDLIKSQYSVQRISKDLLFVAKDVAAMLQVLPRQIRWMFRKFNSNDFAFEIKSEDLRALTSQIDKNGRRTSLSLVAASLFVAGTMALQYPEFGTILGHPALAMVLLALAAIMLLRLLLR
ncbi:MAG: AarF/ABC1/UbiB kinase family protein [Bdellovibrionales bacterium]|nr:AarF/ABC1/UbiB kinase family protein [Bdellovibrionales bacterium]